MPISVYRFSDRPAESLAVEQFYDAPPRLSAHHMIVHDVAARLLAEFNRICPACLLDKREILLGASTHDIGKAVVTEELVSPGRRHEDIGPDLLLRFGMTPSQARFARTHGHWRDEPVNACDLIVALADTAWKGSRDTELELRLAAEIAQQSSADKWNVLGKISATLDDIGLDAQRYLAYQQASQ